MTEKKKILVADDDVQFVDSVKTLLESVGYNVFYTYKSKDIIDMAKDKNPDLILLDVMFAGPKGPDGFRVSRMLHQDPKLKHIPVIIISGVRKVMHLPFNVEPDERWMPVKAFIEKPIKPGELLSAVREVIGSIIKDFKD